MTENNQTFPTIPFTGVIYGFDDIINVDCDFKGLTVAQALKEDNKAVWKLIKSGKIVDFTDEVLQVTNITKVLRDFRVEHVFVDRVAKKSNKVYKKDTENIEDIVKSLQTLENGNINYDDEETIVTEENEDE